MQIRLDRYLCADFRANGITDINLDVISSGCAGFKIIVTPRKIDDFRVPSDEYEGIRCWVLPEFSEKLDGSQVARAKGRLYLVNKNIRSRCGCGTSFSFEKKSIPTNLTKIHRLQNALKSSPEVQEIQKILRAYK